MSVGNALGRVVHGSLCDRFGFLPVLHGMCAASALALATFTLGAPSKALFTAWCIVTAFFYGGNFRAVPDGDGRAVRPRAFWRELRLRLSSGSACAACSSLS